MFRRRRSQIWPLESLSKRIVSRELFAKVVTPKLIGTMLSLIKMWRINLKPSSIGRQKLKVIWTIKGQLRAEPTQIQIKMAFWWKWVQFRRELHMKESLNFCRILYRRTTIFREILNLDAQKTKQVFRINNNYSTVVDQLLKDKLESYVYLQKPTSKRCKRTENSKLV